jgi:monoamine oxidase
MGQRKQKRRREFIATPGQIFQLSILSDVNQQISRSQAPSFESHYRQTEGVGEMVEGQDRQLLANVRYGTSVSRLHHRKTALGIPIMKLAPPSRRRPLSFT